MLRSRNKLLSAEDRQRALSISQALKVCDLHCAVTLGLNIHKNAAAVTFCGPLS